MRRIIAVILFILLLTAGAFADPDAEQFGYRFIFSERGVNLTINKEPEIVKTLDNGRIIYSYIDCYNYNMDYKSFFNYLMSNWLKPYNLREFAQFSKYARDVFPSPVAEPNEPPIVPVDPNECEFLYINENTKVVHSDGCRYVNELTMAKACLLDFCIEHLNAGDFTEYRGCYVCKPKLFGE